MENLSAKIDQIRGNYTFISPYHKNKKKLPFRVIGHSYNNEFPVQCETVEYRGWKKSEVNSGYKIESVLNMIETGFLTKVNN